MQVEYSEGLLQRSQHLGNVQGRQPVRGLPLFDGLGRLSLIRMQLPFGYVYLQAIERITGLRLRITSFIPGIQHALEPIHHGAIRPGMDLANSVRILVPALWFGNRSQRRPGLLETAHVGPKPHAAGRGEGGLPGTSRAIEARRLRFRYDLQDGVTGWKLDDAGKVSGAQTLQRVPQLGT